MIQEHCYTREWLEHFKKQREHNSIQVDILERMIYALHLLEQIQTKGMQFIFKGGTSLVLLLKEGARFSIDIDIICKLERDGIEAILNKVVADSRFTEVQLDDHRSYKQGIPKAHYKFIFESILNPAVKGTILLDIQLEDTVYPELVECAVDTKWVECDEVTQVTTPSINAITGDKLTAFAPNTVGIPYFKGEHDSSTEICKQLYDLGRLVEQVSDMDIIAKSFHAHATQEIGYRKEVNKEIDLSVSDVLKDTIETCLTLARREKNPDDESKQNFKRLEKGIRSFGAGYLMEGHFRIEDALAASALAAYLAAKILTRDMSPISQYAEEDVKKLMIENADFAFLNKMKKQPDKSIFYYWHLTAGLLSN